MAEPEQTPSNWSDQQAFIAELSQIALTSPTLAALFDMTVRRVKEILKADFCEVLEYDPQSQTLLLRAGAGWNKRLVGKAKFDDGVEWQAGYTLSSDHPVIVDDLSQEQRFHGSPLLTKLGVKSGISANIKSNEHTFGVLSVHSQKYQNFNPGDANFVQSTANILASFIQRSSIENELRKLNTSLESQVEERTKLLRFLQDVTIMAHETSSITDAMSVFLEMVRSFTGWKIGHVLVVSGQDSGTAHTSGYLSLIPPSFWSLEKNRHTKLVQKARKNIHFEQGDCLAGASWKNGAPVLIEDISRQEIVGREALVRGGFKAALAIPVFAGKQIAAVLEFFFEDAGSVTPELLDVLASAGIELSRVIERRRSRERLQAQDELLENVLTQSQIIFWSIDRQGELRLSRRGGLVALGVPAGDQLGINVFEILPKNHPLMEYLNQTLEGKEVNVDFKVDERIYDLHIHPQMDQQGNVTGMNGIAFDITQRIETEQALRKSEQSYRLVVDNLQDYAIYSLDRDGCITSWNKGAKRIKGYQSSEVIGKHYSIFFTQEDRDQGVPQKALEIALRQGKYEAEGWRVRKDGTKFWTYSLLSPFKDENGELQGFTKLVRDITSRREAEQALQESETRFRSIFEFGAMGIALLDLNGNFLLTNPSLQKMLVFQEQELLSHSLKSLSYPFDAFSLMDMYAEIAAGKNNLFRKESRFQRKDKQTVWVSLTFSLVKGADDSPVFVIGLFEDITYRKRMEAELREIKRQLIISEEKQRLYLAQELHDDPMQELYGVLFQLETLDVGSPQDAVPQTELQTQLNLTKDAIEKVIQRLRAMCGQLRPINLAPFGLDGAIREHIDKFREEHPSLDVKLELTYDGQLLSEEVRISLFRIYQQAMGNIIRHAQANHIVVRFYYDNQKASLEVEDDGVGFEVPPNLFRLARQDHLGIAGAAERAELLGGKLTIRSMPGKGTLVHAVVPLKPFEDPAIYELR